MWKLRGRKRESKGLSGYETVCLPEHPKADGRGRVYLHRVLMENHLGRVLGEDEVVHHKNGDPRDNRIKNLEILSRVDHAAFHGKARRGRVEECECANCGTRFERLRRKLQGQRTFCSRRCVMLFYKPRPPRTPRVVEHGTNSMYKNHGCRCFDCRRAHAEAMKSYRNGV